METAQSNEAKKSPLLFIAIAAIVLAAVAAFLIGSNSFGLASLNSQKTETVPAAIEGSNGIVANDSTSSFDALEGFESELVKPEDFLIREDYFRAVYKPDRSKYKLLERASKFLGKDNEGTLQFFGLKSEEEIFEALPPINPDFSETAYLFASGKYFSIGFLEEDTFLQPEFYSNFKSLGVKYWTQPDPKYWVPHGYGSYPSEQFDTLKIGSREEFTGVVFVHAGWGVQTYQGMSLSVDPESKKYFDIEITPANFLLNPSFPKFSSKWAYKVEIKGKLKQGTPPGSYKIGINVVTPPSDLREQWEYQYKNSYFDGATAIKPSGNFIQLNIVVNE